jgi:tripartite ATP-independent transporter DctP family solute receptor
VKDGEGNMKKAMSFVLGVFVLTLFVHVNLVEAAKVTTVKLGFVAEDSSAWAEGARKFKELVGKKTGEFDIQLYPSAQLAAGNTVKEMEMIRGGSIQMGILGGIESSSFVPAVNIFTLPFMFPSYDVAMACENGTIGKDIEKLYEKQNMIILGWGANDFRDFSNRTREIKIPDDMKNLKMRVPNSEMYLDLWRTLGTNPVAMSWPETVGALQTGTIDGQENGPHQTWASKAYELVKYYTVANYSYDPTMLVINKDFFNGLSADDQKILRECGLEAMRYQAEFVKNKAEERLNVIKNSGVKVVYLSNEQRILFQNKVEPFYERWQGKLGKNLIDQLKEEVKAKSKK